MMAMMNPMGVVGMTPRTSRGRGWAVLMLYEVKHVLSIADYGQPKKTKKNEKNNIIVL